MNFTVCIIAKNEEKNLKETLSKLCNLLGKPEDKQYEILVLDTGSTDKTVEVALGFGASVEHFEWIKDFSAARNAAMKFAKNNRILFLDADENKKFWSYLDIPINYVDIKDKELLVLLLE